MSTDVIVCRECGRKENERHKLVCSWNDDPTHSCETCGAPELDSLDARMAEISSWWSQHSLSVITRTAPKAVEYGASDLDIMGYAQVQMLVAALPEGAMTPTEVDQFGRYAACAFYALGKVARMIGALQQGRLPNADCEFDLEVYATMMARIRETGRWV